MKVILQERKTMCTHGNTKKINDVRVCLNCGMTITHDNKVIFDRKIVNYKSKRRKSGKNGKDRV